jgi:hypothetical protein
LTGSDAVNKKILSSSDRGDVSGRYKKRQWDHLIVAE